MLITKLDGGPISAEREAVYLGGLITSDGKASWELSLRIEEAIEVFNKLRKMWSRSPISLELKLKIYKACVLSKLLCSLCVAPP